MSESRNLGIRSLVLVCIFSLVAYFFLYGAIEHWRVARGPWKVTFATDQSSRPILRIEQASCRITNVEICFDSKKASATNVTEEFLHMQPVPFPLPFGECKFQDLLSRPGTVVMQIYGHEIQLMPRTLTIDKREVPWKSGERVVLQ